MARAVLVVVLVEHSLQQSDNNVGAKQGMELLVPSSFVLLLVKHLLLVALHLFLIASCYK